MNFQTGKLYILSGIPGSGKSTFLKSLDNKEMIVSSDAIRQQIIATAPQYISDDMIGKYISESASEAAFEIIRVILKAKFKERLTVFLDFTAINDEKREPFVNLAKEYGIETEILIFNPSQETIIKQNEERETRVPLSVIDYFTENFQADSKFDFRIMGEDKEINLVSPNIIDSSVELDVIGDIHGLYDLLISSIESLGYEIILGIPIHPQGRKLMFLGDVVDRGEDSTKCLLFVKKAVEHGHYAIAGNHEIKLNKNIKLGLTGKAPTGSMAVIKTYSDFVKEGINLKMISEFIQSLPGYYIHDKFVFVHANIAYFDFKTTPFTDMIYGSHPKTNKNTDEEYDKLIHLSNKILIRGHIPNQSVVDTVFSLDEEQAFAGNLVILQLDKMIEKINFSDRKTFIPAFENAVRKFKSDFDYNLVLKAKRGSLESILEKLVTDKYATKRPDPSGMFKLYKYSTKVFYDNLWDAGGAALLKARGIVLDINGDIIQHPFDKVFNYRENGAGLDIPGDETVQWVEKVNGFLGNITLNPYTKKLLITTTGSFDSDFTRYVEDLIDKKTEGLLKKFLNANNVTLSFEVVHSDDPHIIKYEEFELHLIGVRGKNQNDLSWQESDVDNVAKEIGIKRPAHGFDTFDNVKKMVKESKIEGFMVRRKVEDGTFVTVLKFKSPYYLTTKFIGRMNLGNINFMFKNPEGFKEKIGDEEFFPLVDQIVLNVSKEVFLSIDSYERIELIRGIIDELQK